MIQSAVKHLNVVAYPEEDLVGGNNYWMKKA
jgi:hypothetical protein